MIPVKFAAYFWDTDINNVDIKAHYEYVIERILEYGDEEAFWWMKQNFEREKIVETLRKSKRISPKSGNFFARYYKLDPQELTCIQTPFINKQDRF